MEKRYKKILLCISATLCLLTALTACGQSNIFSGIKTLTEEPKEDKSSMEEAKAPEIEEAKEADGANAKATSNERIEEKENASDAASKETIESTAEEVSETEDTQTPVMALPITSDIIELVTTVQIPTGEEKDSFAGYLPLTKDGELITTLRMTDPSELYENGFICDTPDDMGAEGLFYIDYKDKDGNTISLIACAKERMQMPMAPICGVVLTDGTYALSANTEELRVGGKIDNYMTTKDEPSKVLREGGNTIYEWRTNNIELIVTCKSDNTIEKISYLYMEV